jgi:hypothetical protein
MNQLIPVHKLLAKNDVHHLRNSTKWFKVQKVAKRKESALMLDKMSNWK